MVSSRRVILPLIIILIGGALLPVLPKLLSATTALSVQHRLITSQKSAWLVAMPILGLAILANRAAALKYLRLNRLSGAAEAVRWLGIKPGENWRRLGWQIGLVITLVTAVVIFMQIPFPPERVSQVSNILPVVLALSLSNSLAEELIYRHSIVSVLEDSPLRESAPLISGVLFGAVHFFGAPGGFPGVLMAGFLGYILAKSMQETGSMFWAWLIHFVQDVVIIGAMFIQEAGS